MLDFVSTLQRRLDLLSAANLRRELKSMGETGGPRLDTPTGPLLSFASNDYLGLANHPRVQEAASQAALRAGAGAGASRLICGTLSSHGCLEAALAGFKRTESALAFSSGYAAALGVLPALVGPGDFVLLDRLAHACLVDGARLSGARLRVFRHNDVADLGRLLRWVESQRADAEDPDRGRALIVTESVFSMDGDLAPLAEIVAVKERFGPWAWLLVDEAHATGVLGPGRRGGVEQAGVEGRVEVPFGTLGKALGAAGGFVAGSRTLCDYLVHRARSFVFSTAPPPAVAAAATAALDLVSGEEGAALAERLWTNVHALHAGLTAAGWRPDPPRSPILPLVVGDEVAALRWSAALREEGILVPGIRYPTVPRGRARLRLTPSARHEPEDLERLVSTLCRTADRLGIRRD